MKPIESVFTILLGVLMTLIGLYGQLFNTDDLFLMVGFAGMFITVWAIYHSR